MEEFKAFIEKLKPLFSETDLAIFLVVIAMITLLPVFLCVFKKRSSVRIVSLIVFGIYLFGNVSFTLLNREVMSDQYIVLQPLADFESAFYLDLGFIGTIRRIFTEGIGPVLQTIHINRREMAREVLLNILLYIPMGYLLPFVSKALRHIGPIVLIGFLCSCATEFAQLYYHIGCFQIDDIVCNTIGTLIGAVLGVLLAGMWRVK